MDHPVLNAPSKGWYLRVSDQAKWAFQARGFPAFGAAKFRTRVLVVASLAAAVAIGYFVASTVASYHTGLSWELADAPAGQNAQWRVFYWLHRNANHLSLAERRYRVDRLAVAGVVAYEALEDVRPIAIKPLARYSGPGKVHYKEFHYAEGEPVAKVAERLGYLPATTMQRRANLLATDAGAIDYIAAIMAAYAAEAESSGYAIRCRPDLLATFYSAWSLSEAQRRFRENRAPLASNRVGSWVALQQHYLQNAAPSVHSLCRDKS
jgi:hypothetical protein